MCLSQFNVNKLLWNQLTVSIKTKLILLLNSAGLVFDIIMLILSANNIGFAILLMVNEKSFMWMRNSNGPDTEPCGTPRFTCSHLEDTLLSLISFTETLWCLFSKYDIINLFTIPEIPLNYIFAKTMLWLTQSNAFCKSQNKSPTNFFLSSDNNTLFKSV